MQSTHARCVVTLVFASVMTIPFSTRIACGQCRSGGQQRQSSSPGLQQLQTSTQNSFLQQGQPGDALLQQMNAQNALRMQELGWLILLQRQRQQQRSLATGERRDADLPAFMPSPPSPADPEETAAGLLRVATALVADVKTARQFGEREVANRLSDRAEERLRKIVSRYRGTQAAVEAGRVLDALDR